MNELPLLDLKDAKYSRDFFETSPSPWGNAFIFVVLAILIGGFLWAFFAKMDDVVKTEASLRPQSLISHIVCPLAGQITRKSYVQGQEVVRGDSLWETDSGSDRIDLSNTQLQLARVKLKLADCNIIESTIREHRNMSMTSASAAWNQSEYYLAEESRLSVSLNKAEFELKKEKNIPADLATALTLPSLQMDADAARLALAAFKTSEQVKVQEERNALLESREGLERRVAELERRIKNAWMIAPISGRVEEISRVNVGDYVVSGQEILRIVPQSETLLKTELVVAPSDIARMKIGQKIILRFTSLPPSEFGELNGTISLMPADVTMGPGNAPCFIVEADLDKLWLQSKSGEKIYLQVGMSADARVVVDHETVLRMVLKKLDFIK